MRATPAAQPGARHRASEFAVRFDAPLYGAEIVPYNAPLRTTPPAPLPPPQPIPAVRTPPAPRPSSYLPPPVEPRSAEVRARQSAERSRLELVLENVRAEVAKLRREEADRLREWQRAAIELAMTIATRLLHERIVSGEFPMEAKVREMASQLGEAGPVTIRLHPDDLEALTFRLGGKPLLPNKADPTLLPDASLARGECQVEGKEAMLLSDVTRELERIRDELLRSLAHART